MDKSFSNNTKVDQIDIQIINVLLADAKKSYVEVADKINMSVGTVHIRIKKLENLGIITGSNVKVNLKKLGYNTVAFVGIFLEKSSYYKKVSAHLRTISSIVSTYYTTGNYGLFVKVVCKNNEHLKKILSEEIQSIDGILRTETTICLEELDGFSSFITE